MIQKKYKLIRKYFKFSDKQIKRFLRRYAYLRKNSVGITRLIKFTQTPKNMWSRKQPGRTFLKEYEKNIQREIEFSKYKGKRVSINKITGTSFFKFINQASVYSKSDKLIQQSIEYYYGGLILKQPQALKVYDMAMRGSITWEKAHELITRIAKSCDLESGSNNGTPIYVHLDFELTDSPDEYSVIDEEINDFKVYNNYSLPHGLLKRINFVRTMRHKLLKRNKVKVKAVTSYRYEGL